MKTYVFSAPQGGQYLVTVFSSGIVRLSYRARSSDSWGPPMTPVESKDWGDE